MATAVMNRVADEVTNSVTDRLANSGTSSVLNRMFLYNKLTGELVRDEHITAEDAADRNKRLEAKGSNSRWVSVEPWMFCF
jgi:hypothetical protein